MCVSSGERGLWSLRPNKRDGRKHGKWTVWAVSGNVLKCEFYQNGVLRKRADSSGTGWTLFDRNGKRCAICSKYYPGEIECESTQSGRRGYRVSEDFCS